MSIMDAHRLYWQAIEKNWGITADGGEISPQMEVPVFVMNEAGHIKMEKMIWGFPSFKENQYHINVRSETVAEKPTFADSFRRFRGLIPVDGFYEWQKEKSQIPLGTKQLLFTEKLMYLAVVYKLREDGKKGFAILTTQSVGVMEGIHHRMPVMIQSKQQRNNYLFDEKQALKIIGGEAFRDVHVQLMEEVLPREQMNFLDEM